MPRKRRVSIDSVVTFKHQGKPVVVTVDHTKWLGGDKMLYFWRTEEGKIIQTEGVPKDTEVLADPARMTHRAFEDRMAQRVLQSAEKPAVFVDFDETLAHAKQGGLSEHIAAAERAVERYGQKSGVLAERMLAKAKETLAQLQGPSELPEISFSDGTVLTLHPRPGLHQFLGALKSFATLYILSHGSPAYLAKAVPALGIEGYFKGVFSSKGGSSPRHIPPRWVLVDDLAPGTAGIRVKLELLGDTNPDRVVQVKPYQGGSDSALASALAEVKTRLRA